MPMFSIYENCGIVKSVAVDMQWMKILFFTINNTFVEKIEMPTHTQLQWIDTYLYNIIQIVSQIHKITCQNICQMYDTINVFGP